VALGIQTQKSQQFPMHYRVYSCQIRSDHFEHAYTLVAWWRYFLQKVYLLKDLVRKASRPPPSTIGGQFRVTS